jgi:alkylresorcinol/alkylpyrone synthase
MVGDERARSMRSDGPDVVASRSALYPDTTEALGWDIGGSGFRIVLGAGVPAVIERNFAADALGLLADNGLTTADVGTWMAHPGGPKILEAFETALDLPANALAPSWRSLAAVGNLSSAAVLHVLADVMREHPAAGDLGMLFALGPGVTAELVLLRWPERPAREAST